MNVNVCIPVLNSYSELERCIESIKASTVKAEIWVIDNGGQFDYFEHPTINLHQTPYNLGVAASWNWFINNVGEYRIICNDDIQFYPNTLEKMVEAYDENNLIYPTGFGKVNSFSCFLLPQNIINKIGLFDEKISPQYGYFEDNDYAYRMSLEGFGIRGVDVDVNHAGSSTLKNFSITEEDFHHRRFRIARENFISKWGGEPGEETFKTPYNRNN